MSSNIQVSVQQDLSTAIIDGTRIEVTPDSAVTVYTDKKVQTIPLGTTVTTDAAVLITPPNTRIAGMVDGTHISKDFNALFLNGVRIDRRVDGRIAIYTPANVITKPSANNTMAGATEPRIGDVQPDGTRYAGISLDTGKPMYAAAADEPGQYNHSEALRYAQLSRAHGQSDWRVPTRRELKHLFQGAAATSGFGLSKRKRYWSSTQTIGGEAWTQYFGDKEQYLNARYYDSTLRLVR